MKIQKLPVHKRPREKLIERGVKSLSDIDLIALLLRSGYKRRNALSLAKSLMPDGDLQRFSQSTFEELSQRKGIGIVRAASIAAACELAKRFHSALAPLPVIETRTAIQQLSFIQRRRQEHFVALYLNARRELIKTKVISIGTIDSSLVHPREVFAPAIRHNASAVIIGHNHPSGSPEPSHADLVLTKRLLHAGDILGIHIIDHIILGERGTLSFKEHNLM